MEESLIVYSLVRSNPSKGTKNFASLYIGVLMAEKLGGTDGTLSVKNFLTLAKPFIISGLEPERA